MLQKTRFSDPYYRFRSLAEVQQAAALGVRIDVNKASVDDWLRLPGISIHQAQLLNQLLEQGIQFCCLEEIAAVLNFPLPRLLPFAMLLQFCYYDPQELDAPRRVNPNLAGYETLAAIPGIAPALAREIVRDRIIHGPYQNLAEFQRRLSLNVEQTQALLNTLTF
jgi:DNA uptake protein ComE-like DNA-binding protein